MSSRASGRMSPADAVERGLPEDVYINPDDMPIPPDIIEQPDYQPISLPGPAQTQHEGPSKKEKLKGLFKKDKKKKKEKDTGLSQLADVMGKSATPSHASSASSRDDPRDSVPVIPSSHPDSDPDKSRMDSFKHFFKRKPDEAEDKFGTAASDTHTYNQTMDSMKTTVRQFFYGPQAQSAPNSPTPDSDIAPLNPPPPKSPCRMSIFLFFIFSSMVVIGIALTIVGYTGNDQTAEHCMVLGPVFLLLGCFLIIGEVFFMLFWVDDPLPCMRDCMEKVDKAIGGVKDPYGLKRPETYQPQRTSYHPGLRLSAFVVPASPGVETIPMKPMYTGNYDPEPESDAPGGPAALGAYPPGYKRNTSQDSSYQNSSYQDDSFTAGRLL